MRVVGARGRLLLGVVGIAGLLLLGFAGLACAEDGESGATIVGVTAVVERVAPVDLEDSDGSDTSTQTPNDIDGGNALEDVEVAGGEDDAGAGFGDESAEAVRGDVLRLEVDHCGVFDPAIDYSDAGGIWTLKTVHEIHAGLVRVSGDSPPTAELALAARHELSADRLRHDFELRTGVKFSDGSPILSSDVAFSWERALRKSTATSEARDIFGRVVGAAAFLSGESDVVAGIQVIDDRRLAVELTAPDAEFLLRLTRPAAFVLSEDDAPGWDGFHPRYINHEGYPFYDHRRTFTLTERQMQPPVGAGPFRLVEYAEPLDTLGTGNESPEGDRCVLVPNPHYWEPGVPRLDAVVGEVVDALRGMPSGSVARQTGRMASDDLDLALGVVSGGFGELGNSKAMQLVDASRRTLVRFWSLNPRVPPLDDVEVRRALVLAARDLVADDGGESVVGARLFPERLIPVDVGSDSTLSPVGAEVSLGTSVKLSGASLGFHALIPEVDDLHDRVFAGWADRFGAEFEHHIGLQHSELPEVPLSEIAIVETYTTLRSPLLGEVLRTALAAFGVDDVPSELAELRGDLTDAESEIDSVRRLERFLEIERRLIDLALLMPLRTGAFDDEALVQPWVHGLSSAPFGGSVFADVWFSEDAPLREVSPAGE